MKSLSRRFLIGVGLTSVILTALATVAAFVIFQQELSNQKVQYLGDYVAERASNVDRRFSTLQGLHASAARELEARVARLSPADVDRLADAYFPLRPDGTRRSRPEHFDGVLNEAGELTYGMGVFISRGEDIPPLEKAALVAAFPLVSDFGEAARARYDNFYFFTPATRLVMFGPDRPDRLMFYREHAPADLDISGEEMARVTTPALNPSRVTRCTNLQRLVQDTEGDRLATGCLTPAYIGERYVGAFGSSMELTGFFLDAVRDTLPGATSLIVTNKGELIAYPGFDRPGKLSPEAIAAYEERLHLSKVVQAIAAQKKRYGVISSPGGGEIVAYGRLSGPDWYFLLTYPKAALAWSAARSASWVLLIGALAAALQTLLVVTLARRTIVRPIWRLAASCEPEAFGQRERPDVAKVEARDDEIGVLAKALRRERETVEAVLASLEDRVRERTEQLERANAEKSRFLANMSHELRTPLNGVIAISETLAAEQSTPKGRELAELIVSSGRLLEQVLTDILDFSKIEAGEITLACEAFDMEALVRRIAELHRASAERKGLEFGWQVAPEARGAFSGDTVRLTQVLSNLLSNAVKFTEAGRVELRVEAEDGQVRFVVSDTGIGFDETVKARLFRRFEQADASIRRRFGGTGLGLAISRSLVELMGGEISVESEPGRGSVFSFILPLPLAEAGSCEDAEPDDEAADLTGRRILLAEDHPTNQRVVQLILGSLGVDLVIVENGALALDRLREETFDLVLMDMQMPDVDGLTATVRLREMELEQNRQRTPVIMLTANAMDEHVRAGREAGADHHLAKPIHAAGLIQAIVQAVAARAEPPEVERGAA